MKANVEPTTGLTNVPLGMLGSRLGDMTFGNDLPNRHALPSGTVRSFNITVTFINSINLAEGTGVDITFDGSSGPVGTFTVYAPAPGKTEVFHFCLNAAGESHITSGSDEEDTVLIVVSTTS